VRIVSIEHTKKRLNHAVQQRVAAIIVAVMAAVGLMFVPAQPAGASPEDGYFEVQAPHNCESSVTTFHPDTGYRYTYSLVRVEERWIDYGAGMEKQYWHIYAADVFYPGPPIGAAGMVTVGWAQKHCGSEYYPYGTSTA
jgi:hypothetical protein